MTFQVCFFKWVRFDYTQINKIVVKKTYLKT